MFSPIRNHSSYFTIFQRKGQFSYLSKLHAVIEIKKPATRNNVQVIVLHKGIQFYNSERAFKLSFVILTQYKALFSAIP